VLFAAWGAQEPGEIGSRYYLEHPVRPLTDTIAVLQLDSVGGGRGYFLEAQGDPNREGFLRFTLQAAEDWVDGRLSLTRPSKKSDHSVFREIGIPAVLLTWRESSEDNLPSELADAVEPYRLGVTGRMTSLTLMALAQ
jgi:Zn-dependent M28 family amino/carboxypeptidase